MIMQQVEGRGAAGHLVKLGDGGAERLALRWAESARSVECERV